MKTMKTLAIALFIVGSMTYLSSCKEDENPTVASEFTIDGTTYKLAKGFLEDEGTEDWEGNTYHVWELTLTSEEINWDDGYSGQGEIIYMYLYAANDDSKLPEGNYQSDLVPGENIVELEEIYVLINYTIDPLTGDEEYLDFKSAVVDVSKDGNTHTIVFDLTTVDDKHIKGSFAGELVLTD